MIRGFLSGLWCYAEANRVVFKHKLWSYMLVPGALSLIYAVLVVLFGVAYLPDVAAYAEANWIPQSALGGVLSFFTTLLLWLLLFVLGFMAYKHVVLIFFSPVLGYLSEVTEKAVTGQSPPDFDFKQLFKDIARSLKINLKNLALSLVFSVLAWLLVVIPLIGVVISAIALFAIQAYYGGFGFIDITMERKRYSVPESFEFIRKRRGLVTGVGTGFLVLALIPLFGWFIAPAYSAIAATLAILREEQS